MKNITREEAKASGLKRYFTGKPCVRGHISERITANGCCHDCFLEDKKAKRSKRKGYKTREELDAIRSAPFRTCKACGETFPSNSEHFVLLKNKKGWEGLSSECRSCRNKRFKPFYKKNRKRLIKRAIKYTRKRRLRPEVRERERIASREAKRRQLSDPIERAAHNKRGRDWRKNNPRRVKLFKHNQPHIRRMRAMQRYAQELKATPSWANRDRIELIYNLADSLTRKTGIKYEVDHYYPLMGKFCSGLHVPENMWIITAEANRAKGNKMPAGELETLTTEI